MATLYLHVGHGKTGSSWIQSCLRLSEKLLFEQGIVYAKGSDSDLENSNKITSGNASSILESKASFEAHLQKCIPQNGESLLFSSEFLFKHFILSNAHEFIETVASRYGFDQIKILLFIRNPISTVVSVWQQRIKRAGFHHISLSNLHENTGIGIDRVDYVEKLLDCLDKCNSASLTVRNYSNCKTNLHEELANWLEVPQESIQKPPARRVNRSMTLPELMMQKELNRVLGKSGQLLSDPLCEKLTDIEPDSILPPLFVQEAIWEKVKPTVSRVNKRLPIEQQYQCDIQVPVPFPEKLCFSHEQVKVIAESLGTEIKRLQCKLENTDEATNKLKLKIQELNQLIHTPHVSCIQRFLKKIKLW